MPIKGSGAGLCVSVCMCAYTCVCACTCIAVCVCVCACWSTYAQTWAQAAECALPAYCKSVLTFPVAPSESRLDPFISLLIPLALSSHIKVYMPTFLCLSGVTTPSPPPARGASPLWVTTSASSDHSLPTFQPILSFWENSCFLHVNWTPILFRHCSLGVEISTEDKWFP